MMIVTGITFQKYLQDKVTELINGIKSGDVDVYAGFDEYRLQY